MYDIIGIAMATYNGGDYISEMLDSIEQQTHKNFIIHLCDDGSKDNTLDIVKNHSLFKAGKINIDETQGGFGAHRNFVRTIAHCDEKYIALCDQDDFWQPTKLETLLKKIKIKEKEKNQKPILVFSDLEIVDAKLNTIKASFYDSSIKSSQCSEVYDFFISNHIPGCAMLFNNHLKKMISPIPDNVPMHDWWICIVAAFYGEIIFIEESLIKYRQHSNNTVGVPGMKNHSFIRNNIDSLKRFKITLTRSKLIKSNLIEKINNESGAVDNPYKKNIVRKIIQCLKSRSGESLTLSLLVWTRL